MKRLNIIIILKDWFGETISTRKSVTDFIEAYYDIESPVRMSLDFTGIDFVSRCAAHEFLQDEWVGAEKYINQCEDVEKMFEIVRAKM